MKTAYAKYLLGAALAGALAVPARLFAQGEAAAVLRVPSSPLPHFSCLRVKALIKLPIVTLFFLMVTAMSGVGLAQDKPADNMEILRAKIKADKKLLVAANMELTESEAKGFWPVYEDYQKQLEQINGRLKRNLESYAADYLGKSMTDDKAKALVKEALSIEEAETRLKSSMAPKLNKVLPARKVARYLQIESKIRAVIRYDLAATVPLVQ